MLSKCELLILKLIPLRSNSRLVATMFHSCNDEQPCCNRVYCVEELTTPFKPLRL